MNTDEQVDVLQVPLIAANPDVPLPIPTQYWLLNIQQPWAYLLVPPNIHLQVTAFGGGAYFLEAYEPEVGPQGPPKGGVDLSGGE